MSHCIFCRITAHQKSARIDHEDDQLMVIHDINPQAPVHLLVIPKKHISRIGDMEETDRELVGNMIYTAKVRAEAHGLNESGYRLVFNNGRGSGQAVFHIHLHLLGGRPMNWPPG